MEIGPRELATTVLHADDAARTLEIFERIWLAGQIIEVMQAVTENADLEWEYSQNTHRRPSIGQVQDSRDRMFMALRELTFSKWNPKTR